MTAELLRHILECLSSVPGRIIGSADYRQSAVVIPLLPPANRSESLDDWRILYERRAPHIPQGGESCFPGGRLDPGESPREAAFRELEEETGIASGSVDHSVFFGSLVNTGGRIIHAYAAILDGTPDMRPNEEVEKLFTVPLGDLRRAEISEYKVATEFRRGHGSIPFERYGLGEPYTGSWRGSNMSILFYEGMSDLIWGMTARITAEIVEALYACEQLIASGGGTIGN
jgi:coenzyme A diphosphatase NUDT7